MPHWTQSRTTPLALAALAVCGVLSCSRDDAQGGRKVVAKAAKSVPSDAGTTKKRDKACCMGLNACKGQGGCAVPESHACAGKNACAGRGGCRAHCPR